MLVLKDISQYSSVVLDGPPLSDDELLAFCNRHEEWRVESNAEGEIEMVPLPSPVTGRQNADIIYQLSAVAAPEATKIWHVCPEFVIELRSPSDRIRKLGLKMDEWIDNGAALAWLVDSMLRQVTIYRPGRTPELLLDPDVVRGEGPVEGFALNLKRLWETQQWAETRKQAQLG
ncbi:MAG: Uma2 family endonuclease [Acidobacteria bacterium]|nr:Uma2 family endonuclease [Acidobacteriota bacterium]